MKSVWKWILLGLAVFLLAFCIALPLFSRGALLPVRAFSYRGMMPMGMMGLGVFGWLGVLARLAVPVLFVALIVALVWIVVRSSKAPSAPASTPCPSCGKPVQQGWVACPHCGAKL